MQPPPRTWQGPEVRLEISAHRADHVLTDLRERKAAKLSKGSSAEGGRFTSPGSKPQPRSLLCCPVPFLFLAKACLNKRAHNDVCLYSSGSTLSVQDKSRVYTCKHLLAASSPSTVQLHGGPWKESHVCPQILPTAHAGMNCAEQPRLSPSRATERVSPPPQGQEH